MIVAAEAAQLGACSSRLRGKDKIGLAVGKVPGRYKMTKHFLLEIEDNGFSYGRNPQSIAREGGSMASM